MKVLAVDLAAKYSAAVTVDDRCHVSFWVDSWGITEDRWIKRITRLWEDDHPPDALAIEDLPHGVPFMTNTKAVCRLQGRIIERMHALSGIDDLRFVAPAYWRRHFNLKNGSGVDAMVRAARDNGFTPPDLSPRIARAGDSTIARKVGTDYCSAFLIGFWFVEQFRATGQSMDFPGSTRAFDPVPRRARRPTGVAPRKVTPSAAKG